MKVISDNIGDWKETYICGGCKSELEVDSDDVGFFRQRKESTWGHQNDWHVDAYYIRCPVCKVKIVINDLPDAVKSKARNS